MNKIVFFFAIFLLFSTEAFSQCVTIETPNGHNIICHPNGRVASEGMMRDGKPDGYWKSYYVTGVMMSEGNRINFMMDSTWVFYTLTGDTADIINYRLGKRSGYRYLYETITERNNVSRHYLKSKELFLDDRREGMAFHYFPNGKIRETISYRNGRRQGFTKQYDENGMVIALYRYHNDYPIERQFINRVNERGEKHGVWKTFHANGQVKEEEYYRNGVLDGPILLFTERGTPIGGSIVRDGETIEVSAPMTAFPIELTTFYDDGATIRRRGTYLDSIPIGYHYFFNSSGVPERVIRYNENGIRIGEGPVDGNSRINGEYRTFFDTGELRTVARYTNNAPNGEITYFYKGGNREQTGFFNMGVREGEWKWYFPSGNILREETYVRGIAHGLSVQYSDSATIVAKGEYAEGEREGLWIENVGHSREEGKYIMGLKDGMWRTYYNDGQLHHAGNFVHGVPDGRHMLYYPDGTLMEEQHYVMGRRDKNWRKFYENGALFLTITYRNDEEIRINGIRIDDIRSR